MEIVGHCRFFLPYAHTIFHVNLSRSAKKMATHNSGKIFRFVRITCHDGGQVQGLVCEASSSEFCLRIAQAQVTRRSVVEKPRYDKLTSVWCKDIDSFQVVQLPTISNLCYDQTRVTTGGIGNHVRWRILSSNCKTSVPARVVVCGICGSNRAEFESFVRYSGSLVKFFPDERQPDYSEMSGHDTCDVELRFNNDIIYVQSMLARLGLVCFTLDATRVREAELMPERLDRAGNLWSEEYRNDESSVGPVRCIRHWKQHYMLPLLEGAVFTWKQLSKGIINAIGLESAMLCKSFPRPLSQYILRECNAQTHTKLRSLQAEVMDSQMTSALAEEMYNLDLNSALGDTQRLTEVQIHCGALFVKSAHACQELYREVDKWKRLEEASRCNPPDVSAALTEEQYVQILQCTYLSLRADLNTLEETAVNQILFQYMLCGWTCRFAGKYTKSGKHMGHGNTLRRFRGANAENYRQASGDVAMQNRIQNGRGMKSILKALKRNERRKTRVTYDDVVKKPQNLNFYPVIGGQVHG